jgi:hypothetical protein
MRVMKMSSAGGEITLDGRTGVQAGLRMRGLGLPPMSLQWFDGAGDGSTYRGGRVLPRVMDMPVKIVGADRAAVLGAFSALARVLLADRYEQTRLTLTFDDDDYWIDVVRTGGGDYTFGVDTDGKTILQTVLTVEAGRPFFTRVDSQGREITPEGVGLGMLGPGQSLTSLILASTDGFGETTITNVGDVDAWTRWRLHAPFSGFALLRGSLALEWAGAKSSGYIDVDMLDGTVVDETGANRYGGLLPAPKFWALPPGEATVSVVLADAASESKAVVNWNPRKAVMF